MAKRKFYSGRKSVSIPDYVVDNFYGLNTITKSIRDIEPGQSYDSLNWITGWNPKTKKGDHIELRRGQALLGTTRQSGTGKVTGLGVGTRFNGTQIPFYTHDRKIKYYNPVTADTAEIDTVNILPTSASGEDMVIAPYQNLAGSFVYLTSPNSSIYKIPVANPNSAVDQSSTTYRFGVMKIGQARMFAGQRNGATAGNNDKTGLYLSYIDKALLSNYTQVTGESYGTGDAVTKTFAHTLSAVTGKRTGMYISVTDSVETFVDDRNGVMNGTLGGTGTVNYATGAVSVTFNTAPINLAAITCSYYWEDSTTAGIADFTYSGGGRTAGQGNVFRQDDGGGNIQAVFPIADIEYCFHAIKTWQLQSTSNDVNSTNLNYRDHVGVPYPRAAFPTGDGILFLDNTNPAQPKFRALQIMQSATNTTIVPVSYSDMLDLSSNSFDYAVVFRWADYDILCCQKVTNGVADTFNSVMYIRNIRSGYWDKLDYSCSALVEYAGTLLSGDSLSNNLFTLFSGFDDDGNVIPNHWISGQTDLRVQGTKRVNRLVIEGLIQKTQKIKVSIAYDGGNFITAYTIDGQGVYVDVSNNTTVGSYTLGSKVLGGGGGTVTAYPFLIDFPISSDIFEYVQVRFEATDVGFAQVNRYTYKDIRYKGRHLLPNQTI